MLFRAINYCKKTILTFSSRRILLCQDPVDQEEAAVAAPEEASVEDLAEARAVAEVLTDRITIITTIITTADFGSSGRGITDTADSSEV